MISLNLSTNLRKEILSTLQTAQVCYNVHFMRHDSTVQWHDGNVKSKDLNASDIKRQGLWHRTIESVTQTLL